MGTMETGAKKMIEHTEKLIGTDATNTIGITTLHMAKDGYFKEYWDKLIKIERWVQGGDPRKNEIGIKLKTKTNYTKKKAGSIWYGERIYPVINGIIMTKWGYTEEQVSKARKIFHLLEIDTIEMMADHAFPLLIKGEWTQNKDNPEDQMVILVAPAIYSE